MRFPESERFCVRTLPFRLLLTALAVTLGAAEKNQLPPLQTAAEASGYTETTTYDSVVEFCRTLDYQSDLVRLEWFGESGEGRPLPLLIIAPSESADQGSDGDRLTVLCFGAIHGGEVCGKEAMLELSRDLARAEEGSSLGQLVLLFAPVLNADGNERISPAHRPQQMGPVGGVGVRTNAQGLDLNRDFVKLDAPEIKALVRVIQARDPSVIIDTHTTNGSFHRYTLTYDGPRHPATDPALLEFVGGQFLPSVRIRMQGFGFDTFYYGNFTQAHTRWETYPALPRYSTHYFGLRNRIGILSEAYAYATFEERVRATKAFVQACLEEAAENKSQIQELVRKADQATVQAARDGTEPVALRAQAVPLPEKVSLKGFADEEAVPPAAPREYEVEHWGATEATLEVTRPQAYLYPSAATHITARLQAHGIEVQELREDIVLDVERYRITAIHPEKKPFQGHRRRMLTAAPIRETRLLPAGTHVVPCDQKLGTLAAYLLEPEAEDGLASWNLIAPTEGDEKTYPVLRFVESVPLLTVPAHDWAGEKLVQQPITPDVLFGQKPADFTGSPVRIQGWDDSGSEFIQIREGKLYRIDALSGRGHLLFNPEKVTEALQRLPELDAKSARAISRRTQLIMDPDRTGAVTPFAEDLYYFTFDGSRAARLTYTPGEEELVSFSPDGRWIAFVREDNLYLLDLASRTERALTTDGGGDVRNGKADWIYFEELYHRNWKAYWWSPDSQKLAFHQFDSSALPLFHALDTLPLHGRLEKMRHPKAGDPNPVVRLGVVSVAGGPVRWADLSQYLPASFLISYVGWMPEGDGVYYHAQNRIQTWLDFNVWDLNSGKTERLFRDATEAWIESPGEARFIEDADFLTTSDRTGWTHLYRFRTEDKEWETITSGEWEVRTIHAVDQAQGWIYFSGTRDSPIAINLYRCRFDGSEFERLTSESGNHRVELDPSATYFIDHRSRFDRPETVRLFRTDGSFVRTLDSNPVRALDQYEFGESTLFQIETPDGFQLEASMTKPPDFDPEQRYPVWFMTYGGPKAPTIRDGWSYWRAYDQMLAQMGLIVFRMDPRSASGKGSVSAWTAYRRLGIQELEDITAAIEWLRLLPFVDPDRIGMSGHSYGGFMTAFALTHSDLFAGGIAGAPVTDWRYYDTIYTERFMDVPQANPEGYDSTSVVKAADQLQGKLLLLHGMMDDNVHLQNATQLVDALQKADKQFELMLYPQMRHGLHGGHYSGLILDFIRRTLKLDESSESVEARRAEAPRTAGQAQTAHEGVPELYARVDRIFHNPTLWKPSEDEGSASSTQTDLYPLLLFDRVDPSESEETPRPREASRSLVAPALEPLQVSFSEASVFLGGNWRLQQVYRWSRQLKNGQSIDQGIRVTFDQEGRPVVWEVLNDSSGAYPIYVSEALEAAAREQFSQPVASRRYAVERPIGEENGRSMVLRVLSDAPVPLGPWVYLDPETMDVTTLLCRCMPAQVTGEVETRWYHLQPSGGRDPAVDGGGLAQSPWPRPPDWIEEVLRLPTF